MRSRREAAWATNGLSSGCLARRCQAPGGGRHPTSSCTLIRRTRSWTGRRSRRSLPRGPPSSATRRWRSPTTTGSTARSSSRIAAKHFGVRPITGAEVTLAGGAHVTLLCETQGGYANLCRILTDAHAGTRPEGKEHREPLPAATTIEVIGAHAEGLVCLSGCARHGVGSRRPERRRSARVGVSGCVLRRAAAAVRARRRAPERTAARARGARSACRRSRPATCTRTTSGAPAAGRARRDSAPHVARRLRARTAGKPRVGAAVAGGDARAAAARRGATHAGGRRSLPRST